MNSSMLRALGEGPMLLCGAALLISAMSTLDSTLSSASKLVAVDIKLVPATVRNGRINMLIFMLLGLLCVYYGTNDLFSAVAVSGTASMFLAPVVFFSIFGKQKNIPVWSYVLSFIIAMLGAALYFLESSGHTELLGEIHKYTKLLWISIFIMLSGVSVFYIGLKQTVEKNSI